MLFPFLKNHRQKFAHPASGKLPVGIFAACLLALASASRLSADGNAAEIPAWTANPVTPAGNISQQGVTDSSGNLWFVTDDGVVQKIEAGDPAAAGTGVLTTIPGLSGATGDYVSKPIILDVGGQDYMFVAGQNNATEANMHKIRLSDGNRQQFSDLSGGNEKLKGLSEHNGKIYVAYSTTGSITTGAIVRLDTAGGMSKDTTFSGNGRLSLPNGRDFGIVGSGAQVEIAFDSADNLYVTADRIEMIFGTSINLPTMSSFAANGVNHLAPMDVGGSNNATGGLTGNSVHSPVVDGANIYVTLDSSGFGGTNQIQARQTSDGSPTAGFTTIDLGGERAIKNPVVSGANLYVSTDQGKVHSYNKTTGAFVATFDSGSSTALTMPVFDGTDFYVGQANSRVHKVDSATMTRDASWPAPGVSSAGAIGAPPLVVGNEVYVVSSSRVQGFEVPVSNANAAPVITSYDGAATAAVNAPENQTFAADVNATDADGNATVSYVISGGADADKFDLNASTGVLTFKIAPDYENPTDADANNTYVMEVNASDGTAWDLQTLTVTVTNMTEFKPATKTELETAVDLWISDNATALSTYGVINFWDTSLITSMSTLFHGKADFNDDISGWDVSNVTSMYAMFKDAGSFNQDISGWNVSNVTNMEKIFWGAVSFNQDIGGWDVLNVTNATFAFCTASSFNQNLNNWDVSQWTSMYGLFYKATSFNGDISSWDVSNVHTTYCMFEDATGF